MRAAQYDRYGSPDVLHVSSAPIPATGPGEVLVRVQGTSVNHLELAVRAGRLALATGYRFPKGTGTDFAGEVFALGEGVTGYAPGDRVWGFLDGLPSGRTAAAAEYVVAKTSWLSPAPAGDLVELAALPRVGVTALQALVKHGKLKEGDRVLIRGASGGVGSAALQLAKAMGGHVTALVGQRSLDFARDLGADVALDYRTHGPDQIGQFDLILDLNGTRMGEYHAHLARHGRMVAPGGTGAGYILVSTLLGSRRVRAFSASPKAKQLADLANHVERGDLRPIIDTVHPLAEIAQAHRALEAGGGRGKQVVAIG